MTAINRSPSWMMHVSKVEDNPIQNFSLWQIQTLCFEWQLSTFHCRLLQDSKCIYMLMFHSGLGDQGYHYIFLLQVYIYWAFRCQTAMTKYLQKSDLTHDRLALTKAINGRREQMWHICSNQGNNREYRMIHSGYSLRRTWGSWWEDESDFVIIYFSIVCDI